MIDQIEQVEMMQNLLEAGTRREAVKIWLLESTHCYHEIRIWERDPRIHVAAGEQVDTFVNALKLQSGGMRSEFSGREKRALQPPGDKVFLLLGWMAAYQEMESPAGDRE